MCNTKSNHSIQSIVEVCELFQEFLKLTTADGLIESWCIEVSLQNDVSEFHDPKEMSHILGYHSLCSFLQKKLEELNHENNDNSCGCGWDISELPEAEYRELPSYAPGTVIRWSQGECNVLLSSPHLKENSLVDIKEDKQNVNIECEETNEEKENMDISLQDKNEGATLESYFEDEQQSLKSSEEPPHKENSLLEHIESSKEESTSMKSDEVSKNEENVPNKNQIDLQCEAESERKTGESLSQESEEDENSCMLVINEDGEDNAEEEKNKQINSEQSSQSYSFPSVAEPEANINEKSDEEEDEVNESEIEDDDDDDDDTSSVTSSTSTSSSSSSSSSSLTSSDDDDRINFKKRVEQAAQAAREAAAANDSNKKEEKSLLQSTELFPNEKDNLNSMHSSMANESKVFSMHTTAENAAGTYKGFSAIFSVNTTIGSTFSVQRHPDDIQAAQGLAALGKSQSQPSSTDKASTRKLGLSKTTQHLLEFQNSNFDILKLDTKRLQCDICGKLFHRVFNLLEHRISHTQGKPWQCDNCDKKFSKLHVLQRHKKAKHTPSHLQEFSCCICGKNFGSQSVLQTHLSTHSNSKPHSCSICGQTFALKFTRDTHEAQHTGNRPWSCNVCGKSYITKYKLKAHMKSHTEVFYCSLCDKQFASQDVMTRHRRRHEAAATEDSVESNVNKTKLKNTYIRRGRVTKKKDSAIPQNHSAGEFRCQMCNKTFDKSADLTHHLSSCSTVLACSPITVQTLSSSILPDHSLLSHPQPIGLLPDQTNSQLSLTSFSPPSCMMEAKKAPTAQTQSFPPCGPSSNLVDLDQRSFISLQNEGMVSLSPFQQVISQTGAPPQEAPVVLPDYLKEVDFGASFATQQNQR